MDSDNHSTALPVTRNEPKDDSGYASQEPSPPPNSSRSFSDRAIAKGKSIMPNYIRNRKLRCYEDKQIPELTWKRLEDLRKQYAESLNNFTRGLPNCTSILMTLKVLGENEESAEPWVYIQCDKAVVGKITRFFQRSVIRYDFEPPQPDDRFPRLRVFIHSQKPRPLVATGIRRVANEDRDFYSPAESEGNEIYVLKSDVTPSVRRGTQIMTECSHGVRQAVMGGLIKTIDSGKLETVYGMTVGHFVFEGSYDDGENSPVSDSDEEYDEDVESFELELGFIEAKSEDENNLHVVDKRDFEVDGKVNMDKWSRLGKLSMASHNLSEDGSNLDWGLITIHKHSHGLPNPSLDIHPAPTNPGGGQSSVKMNSARGTLNGILHGSWSYIMLPPGKVLVRTYLLSLSDGESLQVGDSGAWIIDSSDSTKVFGHLVASDVFGHGYVIPMYDTLEDIQNGLARLSSKSFSVTPAYRMKSTPIPGAANTRYAWRDKEEMDLEKAFLRHEKSYQDKEVELLEAGEDVDNNKDLQDIGRARDIANIYHLIRKAELRYDMKLAAQLKMELEKLPGYKDYIISSESGTTGPQELSITHDTEGPTGEKTPEGEFDEGKGST
ncbi:uncharacterized protein EAE97_011138 [Botrytis byssoidea]|uniref:Uncharacterized protein n=1 Tax=Botrytis byssoidea TaxID=139641 RepID=A0A9P5LUC3_9HELO|nr:uncharacterized protein EAE97_011138 [Botrytis byssoidea]KAF7922396.1 hypothetical protein EAE97_011138 [Botrytis byssoidea]